MSDRNITQRGPRQQEQKGCCKGTRDTGQVLYIDQLISKESKSRRKKCSKCVDWLQEGYDLVPQSLIIDSIKMYKISDEVIKFIENTTGQSNWLPEEKA